MVFMSSGKSNLGQDIHFAEFYPEDYKMTDDLLRKELYSLKADEFEKRDISPDIFSRNMRDYLNVHTHQLFCRNFFNADSKQKALILEHDCHAAGTKVLVLVPGTSYNGILKDVVDVQVGDVLFTQSGLSIVTSLSTGVQDSVILSFTIGSFSYNITCNNDHLVTVRNPNGLIQDIKASDLIGINTGFGLLRPWATGYGSALFLNGFSIRFQKYDPRTVPDLELRTYASLCGYQFVNVGTVMDPYYRVTQDKVQSVPFVGIASGSITYYGFSLSPVLGITGETSKRYILESGIITHNTGTGKTLTACAIIKTFLETYKRMYAVLESKNTNYGHEKLSELQGSTPYVLIVGFEGTQEAFFRELTNYPEFGFVTPEERNQLHMYKMNSEKGDATFDDQRRYRELYLKIRKRLTDKSQGGFFDFKGFQELVNFLFDVSRADVSLDFIEKESARSGRTVQEIFDEMIKSGQFRPRQENLNRYKNSLIVTDELHNTYNSVGKNSRGIVLQYLLDNIPGVRFLGLSATLLNSSPAEFIDVLNYVLPEKIRRDDFFAEDQGKLVFKDPEVPEKLGLLSKGYFSFLKDSNPKYYPRMTFSGTELVTETGPVKYQKFIQVPMSRELQEAHEKVIQEHGLSQSGRIQVPVNSEVIFDATLPTPDGLLTSSDQVSRVIGHASQSFLDKAGLTIYRDNDGIRLGGPLFFRKNLERWSPKYARLLDSLDEVSGKCVIFHKKVRSTGVLMIEEILKSNGFIGMTSEPHGMTKCSKCLSFLKDHKKKDHEFIPMRYLLAYGQNKSEVPGILARYNSAGNSDGHLYKVLIGSKVIRESYDFKDVRHMFIVDCPVSISMTLQIYGRAVRKNSHIRLPPEDWTVTIHNIVHVVNPEFPSSVKDSAESQRYKIKMDMYLMIQEIDKYRHMYAVDAPINRGTIWSKGDPGHASLGALYFDPKETVPDHLSLDQLHQDKFKANKFFKYEINTMILMIKRLFLRRRVWTYLELLQAIRNPEFAVETNPKLFDEDLLRLALSRLVNSPNFNDSGNETQLPVSILVSRLADPEERRIILETGIFRIIYTVNQDEYFTMVPCDSRGAPVVDAGIMDQGIPTDSRRVLGVDSLLAGSHVQKKYSKIKDSMIQSCLSEDLEDFAEFLLSWPVEFQELFIQDCIRVGIEGSKKAGRDMSDAANLVLSGLDLLGTTITFSDLVLYKQDSKFFKKTLPGPTVIGYESSESLKIINQDGQFTDISKTVFNRMDIFRPTGSHIGIIESGIGQSPKFKIKENQGSDRQGIVCHTKTKEQLVGIMHSLGIKPDSHRTKAYCRDIFMKLLDLEIDARENEKKDKFLYFWWNKL